MATSVSHEKAGSLITPSTAEQDDNPPTQLPAPTPVATATAPSYSPIYAAAQPDSSMGTIPIPTEGPPDSGPSPISTTATATTNTNTTTSTSPPPPQPGALPIPLEQSTEERPEQHPPAPAPAQVPVPDQALPTTSTTYAPPLSTPGYSASYSNSSSYSSPPSLQQRHQHHPQHKYQHEYQHQQPQYPNSTSTPYASVYQPPSATVTGPAQLPIPLQYNSASSGGGTVGDEETGLWGGARSWLQSAGRKLAEVEAEVWRRINEAHDE